MLTADYGKKIAKAFEAINQLHADAAKLLSDCDSTVGNNKTSIFGNVITRDLSKAIYEPDGWMPYAVYRYYDYASDGAGVVDGILIYFWDKPPHPDEPMLIAGRVKYRLEDGASVKSVCNEWDLWFSAFDWSNDRTISKQLALLNVGGERIEQVIYKLMPLYSIRSIEEVVQTMNELRGTDVK